jgi:hypothetical protein
MVVVGRPEVIATQSKPVEVSVVAPDAIVPRQILVPMRLATVVVKV